MPLALTSARSTGVLGPTCSGRQPSYTRAFPSSSNAKRREAMRKGLSTRRPLVRYTAAVVAVACLSAAEVTAQSGAANGEWGVFGADAGATRFSPLDQIHAGNVGDLEVAWRWSARGPGHAPAVRPDANQSPRDQRGPLYDRRQPTQRGCPRCGHGGAPLELAAGRRRTKMGRHHRTGRPERRARRELLDGWSRR